MSRPTTHGQAAPGQVAPSWAWWLATGLGSGRLKPAPGTWGSLAGLFAWLLVAWLASPLGRGGRGLQLAGDVAWLALLVGLTLLAVRAADLASNETGHKDPGYIVIDEWAGMWVALHPVRWIVAEHLMAGHLMPMLGLLALPFLAFRLFDIWKPWPCDALQDLPGGQGIVADDLVAGLYAALVTATFAPSLVRVLFGG